MKYSLNSILIILACLANTCFAQESKILDSLKLDFIEIPAGSFIMGSTYHAFEADSIDEKWFRDEAPVHRVSISNTFELSSTEITRHQFEIFIKSTGYITDAEKSKFGSLGGYDDKEGIWVVDSTLNWKNPGYNPEQSHPITHVSWKDAKTFCNWLNSIDTAHYYSLPTEAEWEYAASYAGKYLYSWGSELPNDSNGGNIADHTFNSHFPNWKYPIYKKYDDKYSLLAPVGSFQPNKYGLYDMTGNAWEWVDDYYGSYSIKPQINPNNISGALYGEISYQQHNNNELIREKVIRGGGFDWELSYLRVTKRRKIGVDSRYISKYSGLPYLSAINVGFRIKRLKKVAKIETDFIRSTLQPELIKLHFKGLPFQQIPWDVYHGVTRIKISQILRIPKTKFYYVFVNGLAADDYGYGQLFFVEMSDHEFGVIGYTLIKEGFYLDLKLELTSTMDSIRAYGKEAASAYDTKDFDMVYTPADHKYWIIYK